MMPTIYAILVPTLPLGPIFLGFGVALVAGVVLLARGASEELRRVAAREWDARNIRVTGADRSRSSV